MQLQLTWLSPPAPGWGSGEGEGSMHKGLTPTLTLTLQSLGPCGSQKTLACQQPLLMASMLTAPSHEVALGEAVGNRKGSKGVWLSS